MRSHASGMSVREVLQEPSRTADSSESQEWLSDMCISNAQIYLVRRWILLFRSTG